jgi:proline dehydrogenase
MSLMRSAFLAASTNRWLRERAPRYRFVRRTVSRFMPGESAGEALAAASTLARDGVGCVLTHLGENVTRREEANAVADHYIDVLRTVRTSGPAAEVSIKLTHLGLDLDADFCYANVRRIIDAAGPRSTVWIDMESSPYVDGTLGIYRRSRGEGANTGVCVQAYLRRTAADVAALLPLGGAIRLVKGAYMEPPEVAFPKKKDVDENYFALATTMLSAEARRANLRAAIATHDLSLIARVIQHASERGLARNEYEFQMLYGIQRAEQLRLAREGHQSIVLVAYGDFWFPWFMRRLAERPANGWFVVKNLFT